MLVKTGFLAVAGMIVFLSGFWLHRTGSPYGVFVLAIHKLVALLALVFIGSLVISTQKAMGLSSSELWIIASALVLLIVTFGSGGIVSAKDSVPQWVVYLHRVVPYFSTALTSYSVYLVISKG